MFVRLICLRFIWLGQELSKSSGVSNLMKITFIQPTWKTKSEIVFIINVNLLFTIRYRAVRVTKHSRSLVYHVRWCPLADNIQVELISFQALIIVTFNLQ